MSLNLRSEDQRYDARIHLPWSFHAEASLQRANWYENTASVDELDYHFSPNGEGEIRQAAVGWRHRSGHGLLTRWTDAVLDAKGAASWGGQRFGRLDYLKGSLQSTLVAAQILWHRAHVGADLAFSPRLKWQMGFGWYDVYPTAVLDSWRPAFLLFGRADEHRDELPFHRLQLIGVSLASQMSLGPLAISFGIQQIIPIRSEFGETIDPGGDQGGVEAEHVEPGEKSMWPNGTTLELYLQRTF
jgi:hypothetical protein